MRNVLRWTIVTLVVLNVPLFLGLAWCNKLHMADEARSAIFIDFWGRLTVYSVWFIGYELYRAYLIPHKAM